PRRGGGRGLGERERRERGRPVPRRVAAQAHVGPLERDQGEPALSGQVGEGPKLHVGALDAQVRAVGAGPRLDVAPREPHREQAERDGDRAHVDLAPERLAEAALELVAQDARIELAGEPEAHRRGDAEDRRAGDGPSESLPEAQASPSRIADRGGTKKCIGAGAPGPAPPRPGPGAGAGGAACGPWRTRFRRRAARLGAEGWVLRGEGSVLRGLPSPRGSSPWGARWPLRGSRSQGRINSKEIRRLVETPCQSGRDRLARPSRGSARHGSERVQGAAEPGARAAGESTHDPGAARPQGEGRPPHDPQRGEGHELPDGHQAQDPARPRPALRGQGPGVPAPAPAPPGRALARLLTVAAAPPRSAERRSRGSVPSSERTPAGPARPDPVWAARRPSSAEARPYPTASRCWRTSPKSSRGPTTSTRPSRTSWTWSRSGSTPTCARSTSPAPTSRCWCCAPPSACAASRSGACTCASTRASSASPPSAS